MRITSFNSVPEPAYNALADLFAASQQMALALIVTNRTIAEAVVQAWGAAMNRPNVEDLLAWAKSMRDEMDMEQCARTLVQSCAPNMNTHPGFFTGPLEETPYPSWQVIALYELLEDVCNDSSIEIDPGSKDTIVAEMVKRGLRHPIDAGVRWPLDQHTCTAFLDGATVRSFLSEWKLQMLTNKVDSQDGRKRYLVRSPSDGTSVLVQRRSPLEAEGSLPDGRAVEVDRDSWYILGGE